MSSQNTSLSELPTDVLCNLVPYLLMGRFDLTILISHANEDSYYWATAGTRGQIRLNLCRMWMCRNVIECAWLPTLRIKLVCKALYSAVDMHMERLTLPQDDCMQAATTIQDAFLHLRVIRNISEREDEMRELWHEMM
mmetsp:Transcript_73341/g.122498  ORF Transcript_73341/g.122498 Transcript_73341/m.122498 type:complete len:138 (+) Transcript_73341:191-604(+)